MTVKLTWRVTFRFNLLWSVSSYNVRLFQWLFEIQVPMTELIKHDIIWKHDQFNFYEQIINGITVRELTFTENSSTNYQWNTSFANWMETFLMIRFERATWRSIWSRWVRRSPDSKIYKVESRVYKATWWKSSFSALISSLWTNGWT